MREPINEIEVGIACDTSELDDAIDKSEQLSELTNDLAPMVSIKNCKGCTFNIYPSRTTINERIDEE
ncbi:MAG: hypothetical protein IJ131_09685 [Eggerthellaceae bacterium]|nr:hypothetical protein [Eggerthellaceae bacterium]